jgi:hypothetical protein
MVETQQGEGKKCAILRIAAIDSPLSRINASISMDSRRICRFLAGRTRQTDGENQRPNSICVSAPLAPGTAASGYGRLGRLQWR